MKILRLLFLIMFILTVVFIAINNSVWSEKDDEEDDNKNLPDVANIVILNENVSEAVDETALLNIYLSGGGLIVLNNKINIKMVTGNSWQLDVKVIDIDAPEGAETRASDFKIKHDQTVFYPPGFSSDFNDLSTEDLRIAQSSNTKLTPRRIFTISHALSLKGSEPAGEYSFVLVYTLTSPA